MFRRSFFSCIGWSVNATKPSTREKKNVKEGPKRVKSVNSKSN